MNIKQLPTHPFTRQQALGFRKDGRPIWPVLGSAPTGDGGDGGEGGTGDGGDNGDQGGLLDDEADNGGGDGGSGGDGGQGGGDGGSSTDEDALVAKVVAALEGRFDSIADRRVNAILKEVRKKDGKDDGDGGNGGGDSGGQQHQQSGPANADVREARMTYREYVNDEIRFLGNEEREHAATLAQGLLHSRLAAGDDPETAGREVAKTVGAQIKALRRHYEARTIAALRRRGQLPDDGRGPGQPPTGPGTPGTASGYQAGAQKAATMFADRMPQQTGSSN